MVYYEYVYLQDKTKIPDDCSEFQFFGLENIELPDLPNSFIKLFCSNNNLTKIPELPDSLEYLECTYNKLTELPELPHSLQILTCGNNILTLLPELPNSLEMLLCNNNNLTELPELPNSLLTLECNFNNIKYLSPNNCQVMKKCPWLLVLDNPFSADFTNIKDFREYLMNL